MCTPNHLSCHFLVQQPKKTKIRNQEWLLRFPWKTSCTWYKTFQTALVSGCLSKVTIVNSWFLTMIEQQWSLYIYISKPNKVLLRGNPSNSPVCYVWSLQNGYFNDPCNNHLLFTQWHRPLLRRQGMTWSHWHWLTTYGVAWLVFVDITNVIPTKDGPWN